ncbi:M20 family metallopeptidase [Glutamicibacter protophormiae]|uniref:M20 family metallopeptidase n=1 Tax=Glutamicibacter protophormiae TaxID=37930 RepID=UPI001958829E|nr:M20/M25/M40 family metallo-hydrolase [Glutamicibacter protophormiae]QRQ78068.1 M20/M25/M40 family metallo-hydrolase [Glutamicibacter protophormiae]
MTVPTKQPTPAEISTRNLGLLHEVLSIDSTWGRETQLAEFMAESMRQWGVDEVALVESMPGRYSVGGRIKGTGGGKSLLLNGHLDTYEISPDWTKDPFAATVEDGKIYGAGIADMKAATTAGLAVMRDIALSGQRPKGDVVFQGVSCHFEGGVGTRSLLDAGFTADAGICGEPTDNTIGTVHRGAAYLKVTTHGKQAHTSAKELGLNAIETMEPILAGMRKFESEMPYRPHPELPGGPNLNIGTIRGGTKHNQVPDRCEMTCDIRLLPSQDPYQVREQAEEMIGRLTAVDPRIKATVEFSEHWLSGPRLPYEIDPESPIAQATAHAVASIGSTPIFKGIPFWTDMVPLAQAGIPAINIGPGTPPYSWADEWVEQAKYDEIIAIYAALANQWCNQSR